MSESLKKYWSKQKVRKFIQNSSECPHQYYVTMKDDPNSKITYQQVMCRKTEDSCKISKCPMLNWVLYGRGKNK